MANQESYFIPNCVAIESLTFNYSTVRYPSAGLGRVAYFGTARADNVTTLPFNYNANRATGGMDLNFYPVPASNYPVKFTGKFALTDVILNTDLLTVYDAGYIAYLRYGLAEKLCQEFGVPFADNAKMALESMERKLMYISPPDLTMQNSSIMQTNRGGWSWSQINIGRGYTVAGRGV